MIKTTQDLHFFNICKMHAKMYKQCEQNVHVDFSHFTSFIFFSNEYDQYDDT